MNAIFTRVSTRQFKQDKVESKYIVKILRAAMAAPSACNQQPWEFYVTDDPEIIARDIADLKEQGAEFVIYQCHWGTEYEENHNALQEAMARACARAGADLVIGHHPHVVQGLDWIGDMPVVYSLGNLMFGGTIRLTTYDAMLAQASFYPDREENRVELRLIPIQTSSSAATSRWPLLV